MQRTATLIGIFLLIILALGFVVLKNKNNPFLAQFLGSKTSIVQSNAVLINSASFSCKDNKTVGASFFVPEGASSSTLGSVSLSLSDKRYVTLNQTMSASGARYANADESFVFWNKGNTAFVEEGAAHTQTFVDCVAIPITSGTEGWNTYASSTMGMVIRYPQEYTKLEDYQYTNRGPGAPEVPGIKFLIPASLYQGTNLSGRDTGVSVEELDDASSTCNAVKFSAQGGQEKTLTENDITYSTLDISDAGAGNQYEEHIFAVANSRPCIAVRYFIHSTNVGNYTPGTVTEYDKNLLLSQFDAIRKSLVLSQ